MVSAVLFLSFGVSCLLAWLGQPFFVCHQYLWLGLSFFATCICVQPLSFTAYSAVGIRVRLFVFALLTLVSEYQCISQFLVSCCAFAACQLHRWGFGTGFFPSWLPCGQTYKFRFKANPIKFWYSALWPSTTFTLTIARSHSLTVKKPRRSLRQHTIMSMETGINQPSNSCYYQLRRFRCVPKCLSTEATATLHGHLTHSVTPQLLHLSPFPSACFLCPYNYSLRCSQNCAKAKVKLTISLLCSNLSTGSQSRREFSTR